LPLADGNLDFIGMPGVVGGVIAAILLAYISRRAAFSGTPGELRHGWFIKWVGWLMAASTLGLAYIMVFTNHRGQYGALSLLIGAFGAGAGCLLLEAYGTSGSFDSEGIALRTPWTGQKRQRWSDLSSATFSPQLGWYRLVFRDGTTMRLSNIIHGYGAALQEIERHGTRVLDESSRPPE
jgi:hypothetical protein